MGRSKFPGKPPKTVTRKRIKVLGRPEATQSDSVTVAENIYYGLSLFNETFGDNEKEHPPFHGFSSKEAKLSVSYVQTQRRDTENTVAGASPATNKKPCDKNDAVEDKNCSDIENHKEAPCKESVLEQQKDASKNELKTLSFDDTSAVSGRQEKKNENRGFSNLIKTPVLKSVNNILDRHQRTRHLRNSTAKRLLQRAKSSSNNTTRNITVQTGDKTGTVRKFVLPVRSAHSSRVIKPNKRFIEELEEISNAEHSENEHGKYGKKARIASGKLSHQELKDEEENVGLMNAKFSGKDGKRCKKAIRLDSQILNETLKNDEKPSNSVQDAQVSKDFQNEPKKSQNVPSKFKTPNRTAQNINNVRDVLIKTMASDDTAQNVKINVSTNHKQISIPIKVLPDSNVPSMESSRVQTRSGTLSEAPNFPNSEINIKAPLEIDQSVHLESLKSNEGESNRNALNGIEKNDNEGSSITDCPDNIDAESTLSENGSDHGDPNEDEQSDWAGIKLNGGKVILRKARLKLDNKNSRGTEGPFSTTNTYGSPNATSISGLAGTVKCGVCGAVRFYRFMKQARKFGIHSCDSCRKFISKMIKRQACAKSTTSTLPILQCHKGDGLCLVPPVVKTQQWNLMRCVYKARCPACWLKMCIKCYNIPAALKAGLNALLPPLMRETVPTSLLLRQDDGDGQAQKLGCKMGWPAEESVERNLFKSAMSWNGMEIGSKVNYQNTTREFLGKKLEKFNYPIPVTPSKKRKKDNGIKVRKKVKSPLVFVPVNQCTQPPRQRVELRGPRVKHVCRSASVALGQPIATFPCADGKEENDPTKNIPKVQRDDEKPGKKDEASKDSKEPQKNNHENDTNFIMNTVQQSYPKRSKSQSQSILAPNLPTTRSLSKPSMDTIHTLSIDFWEQYDPAEVGTKGFALIGSELFHIPAVCYLCGSAGKEPLIHCQCCCEPYHVFCLEPSEWSACAQSNWSCPRCTVCQTCHLRAGPKLSCIRCRQSFHHSCLSKSGVSARLYSPDRPYVCQSCIKCKSCGSEGVSVHVGNLPLCSMCFKLRQRGNYCPLCQRCYNENDFDTKMMECNECSCWVHARCEGLSDERYQVLSYLPDSIEFTCRQCSPDPASIWRNAIEAELKSGFIAVIKALSKNRKTCAALKWSPRKECLCRPVSSVRKLDFSDEKVDADVPKELPMLEETEDCNGDKLTDIDAGVTASIKLEILTKSEIDMDEQNMDIPRRGLRRPRQKFHLKDARMKNCISRECLSGEGKDVFNQESVSASDGKECTCSDQQIIARPSPTLMSVKRKVSGNEYGSLSQFHCDMEHVINRAGAQDLMEAYRKTLKEVFPWFDPTHSKITPGTDGMTTPTKEVHSKTNSVTMKLDDSILETWKEEVLKVPKAIAIKACNLYSNIHVEDSRTCCLCKGLGDGYEMKEGRLLYCGQNEWVHANCALWSNEVFEEIDGSLQNVHSAISRGRLIRCTECGKKGASVGCCSRNCNSTFHYPCARAIGLAFNDDKTVFCSLHLANCAERTPQSETDFGLKRPVYVELDRKKKKYVEPNKVKAMIGSLTIDCLGTVVPQFSDTPEKIIPSDYKCSRLYWSTVNPLKIVKYYIRTYVQVYVPDVSPGLENNCTIDHSKEREREEILDRQKLEHLAAKQTLDALVDAVCSREVDETLAEQNNTDLLPPELEEAIFEDLPHDLLDGIFMQDIFPKMSYEDFLAMDLKSDNVFGTDLLKDDILPSEVEEIIAPPESKVPKTDPSMPELGTQSDFWSHLEAKSTVQDFVDDLFSSKHQKLGGRELKRSKSEVMPNNSLVSSQRHHQRSCSLTWSCKLDGPNMKRRKLPRSSGTRPGDGNVTLMDTQTERPPVFHELRIPESIMVTVGRANTPGLISESMRELKYCIDDSNGINRRALQPRDDGKEHKRLFWHPRQQPRILQVDGTVDPGSASECSSPEYNVEDRLSDLDRARSHGLPRLDGIDDEPPRGVMNGGIRTQAVSSRPSPLKEGPGLGDVGKPHDSRAREGVNDADGESSIAPVKYDPMKMNSAMGRNQRCTLTIPQLDGADDISSDDECTSPQPFAECKVTSIPKHVPEMDPADGPVTCKRCQCTYRTQDSYDRHLATCDIMTTSDSDSETMDNKLASPDSRFSPSVGSVSPQFVTMSPSEGHALSSEYPDLQATSPLEASVPSPHPGIQIEPIAQALIAPQIHTHATVETVHQTVLTSNDVIVQTQYTRTTTTLPNTTVLPQESSVQITEITDAPSLCSDSGLQRSNPAASVPLTIPEGINAPSTPSPQVSPTFSSTGVQTATNESPQSMQSPKAAKPRSPRAPRPRAKGIKPHLLKSPAQAHPGHVRFQPMQSATPVIQLQQAQRPAGPTVILQQVASPNILSAYVETLQQQSGQQNLQYIAAIGGQHEAGFKPQFIAANQIVPGAYIQASSDNLLALQNGGISVLPGVQIAQPQPTVLGTIIQQQPGAIQCGVISSEQLVLSSTPTLEMFTDSTGSMFVSSQPMYYGLETIVSNTVMSSSQFMAGAVPQVLASSYQTTTQVFQASKLMEPIVDVQAVSAVPGVPAVPTVPTVQAVQNVPGVQPVQNVPAVPSIQTVPGVQPVQSLPGVQSGVQVQSVAGMQAVQGVPGVQSVQSVTGAQGIRNLSGVQAVPAVPPGQNVPTVQPVQGLPGVQAVQSVRGVTNQHAGYILMNQQPAPAPEPKRVAAPRVTMQPPPEQQTYASIGCDAVPPPAPCRPSVEAVRPVRVPPEASLVSSGPTTTSPKPLQHATPTIPRVAVRPSPASHATPHVTAHVTSHVTPHATSHVTATPHQLHPPWKVSEALFGAEQPVDGGARPYFDSKHVSENTSMIKPSISSKIPPLPDHCITQRNVDVNKLSHDVNIVHNSYSNIMPSGNAGSVNGNGANANVSVANKISMPMSNAPTSRPMNRVLPMQAVAPKQDSLEPVEKPDIVEEPLKPEAESPKEELEDSKKRIVEIADPVKRVEVEADEVPAEAVKFSAEDIERVKENLKLELEKEKITSPNASLKIVLQKQLQDGSYKITHNMKAAAQNKKMPQVTSVEVLPPKQTSQATTLQLLPLKTFTLKANKVEERPKPTSPESKETREVKENKVSQVNLVKTKTPPVAVKKPRFAAKAHKPEKNDPPIPRAPKKCATGPSLMYEIKSQDGFTHTASSMSEIWDTVFKAVQAARRAHNLPPLPHNPLTENLGLDNNATVYLVEQLPGVNRCTKYKPRFHDLAPPKPGELENDLLAECDNGAARAEPFKGRKVHDMFSWLASRHRQQPKMVPMTETESRTASTNLPMAMRFRILKETSKESVGVYHSHIHGRGLFCLRDIEAGEMVIEYAGEVIRASLTDKREKYYDSKNIGCYMFKIDDHLVVDATMKGNAARFINHSCEPNCYSRVVDILGKKHILIFALRRIVQGEELTYDYKFPFEDIKIPCTCGSRRCRKYLN
ncbi:histone-lysine N-methyltransferase trithorax isoform X2 [Orussus abietinus]|uniref:histone-lysine N-methyltransferase trithorax isoform X2 n=1 Tax=Orussus abietinus TaxID=222816 RepID=UPI0006256C1B|nr:histone-lysine N-methyltransferase trithorax isoform X2 [Orussus abietinus]